MPEDPKFVIAVASSLQYLHRYQCLAQECNIDLVPGTIISLIKTKSGDMAMLNKAYYIAATGEILGQAYAKTNLWHPERVHLTSGPDYSRTIGTQNWEETDHPGSESAAARLKEDCCPHQVIKTPIGPVGLLICYDLAFPEACRALVRAGARIIIIPTFTKTDDPSSAARSYNPDCEALFTQSALITRACENTCAIVFCNVGGPKDESYMGLSQVTLPLIGTAPGSFTNSMQGMRVIEVDLKILDVAEENYRIREDLARDGFHY